MSARINVHMTFSYKFIIVSNVNKQKKKLSFTFFSHICQNLLFPLVQSSVLLESECVFTLRIRHFSFNCPEKLIYIFVSPRINNNEQLCSCCHANTNTLPQSQTQTHTLSLESAGIFGPHIIKKTAGYRVFPFQQPSQ